MSIERSAKSVILYLSTLRKATRLFLISHRKPIFQIPKYIKKSTYIIIFNTREDSFFQIANILFNRL